MLPFKHDSIDVDDEYNIYWNCVFKRDFGPFLGGEHVGCIEVNETQGTLTEYHTDGSKGRQVKIQYCVVE